MNKTYYRAVHRDGTCSLPFANMTQACLFVIQKSNTQDWRTEAVSTEQLTAETMEFRRKTAAAGPKVIEPSPIGLAEYAELDARGAAGD